jgi:hypothetical protein
VRENIHLPPEYAAQKIGITAQRFCELRWRLKNPDRFRESQERLRRKKGIRTRAQWREGISNGSPANREGTLEMARLADDGLTVTQIANRLGVTRGMVSGRLYRLRGAVR